MRLRTMFPRHGTGMIHQETLRNIETHCGSSSMIFNVFPKNSGVLDISTDVSPTYILLMSAMPFLPATLLSDQVTQAASMQFDVDDEEPVMTKVSSNKAMWSMAKSVTCLQSVFLEISKWHKWHSCKAISEKLNDSTDSRHPTYSHISILS